MANIVHPDIVAEISAYCEARGVSRTAFGQAAIGDPSLYNTLLAGRELRRRTIERIRLYMATGAQHVRQSAEDAA